MSNYLILQNLALKHFTRACKIKVNESKHKDIS